MTCTVAQLSKSSRSILISRNLKQVAILAILHKIIKIVLSVHRSSRSSARHEVLDATDDEPWGPDGTALAEIAHATKKFSECQMVMGVLWTRLTETDRNWRHVQAQIKTTPLPKQFLILLRVIPKELSLLPPPSHKGKGIQTGIPNLPSTREVPDSSVTDTEMKDASDPNDSEKGVVPDENLDGASVDAEMGNTPVATHELRPLLRMLAGSSASEFDILKILDEQKESQKDNDPPISLAARRQAYKYSLQQGIVDPDAIEVTFNDFPYYLRFREKQKRQSWAKPFMPGGKPMIEPFPGLSNVFVVSGHDGEGLTLISVLAGDFLLSRACMTLASLKNTEVVSLIATAVEHLVTGETMQMSTSAEQRCILESQPEAPITNGLQVTAMPQVPDMRAHAARDSQTIATRAVALVEYKGFGSCDCCVQIVTPGFGSRKDSAALLDIQAFCITDCKLQQS
ncbi:ATPase, AAA-type, core [Artemisia annua]|uniref:ATPase, AAA-type, core n=1 Tax=Artemisia annua TaxID=35608 RepID=A0A2U1PB49_ARTAN|nr:ATPase, AAA-type, core [Artemisia annua]